MDEAEAAAIDVEQVAPKVGVAGFLTAHQGIAIFADAGETDAVNRVGIADLHRLQDVGHFIEEVGGLDVAHIEILDMQVMFGHGPAHHGHIAEFLDLIGHVDVPRTIERPFHDVALLAVNGVGLAAFYEHLHAAGIFWCGIAQVQQSRRHAQREDHQKKRQMGEVLKKDIRRRKFSAFVVAGGGVL